MKRYLIWTLVLALALPCALFAQPRTKSFVGVVSDGTYAWSNLNASVAAHESVAYELKRLEFTDPTGATTNTLDITYIRTIKLPDTTATTYTTNYITGGRSTNTLVVAAGSATITNSISVISTATNVAGVTQYADGDDFGWGLTFEPYDDVTYTFSNTNDTIYLYHVYDVYPRP